MRGTVSFHPVDPGFFEDLVGPLAAGRKVNPEAFLERAHRLRRTAWIVQRYRLALLDLLAQVEPPPPPEHGTLWEKVRARLERFDHRPGRMVRLAAERIEPDLHLYGRPFLITEGSAERVAAIASEFVEATSGSAVDALILEQLVRLDIDLARGIEAEELGEQSANMTYGNELLGLLRKIHEMARAVLDGDGLRLAGTASSPEQSLQQELPWLTVRLHSRAYPFWLARDVDGLATLCRAAGLEPPACLGTAAPLFATLRSELPEFGSQLKDEVDDPRDVGGYVPPDRIGDLLAFLTTSGAALIRIATRYGEGPACTTMLRKVRECARFAERQGLGYLEAGGIDPLVEDPEDVYVAEPATA